MTDASSAARPARATRTELLALLGLVVLAAALRLPGLETRGVFDGDQGHDMLVLLGITRGEIPLLGPPTSIGTFHHGAVYYYLLAPAAVVSGADPVAVMAWIALFGTAAVAATWWLARLVGGPVAAVIAGALAAVSPSGIEESTFIWNPNLIPVASALAFAAAIHAWQARSPRWWLLAATGAMVTMECHVLGAVILPPLVVGWLLDVRRIRREGAATRPLLLAGAGAVAIIAAGYLPLLVHELTSGWTETRAMLDYVAGGGREGGSSPLVNVLLVAIRSLTWPLVGLITRAPLVAIAVGLAVVGLMAVAARSGPHRRAALGLVAAFAWSVVALALFAPNLAFVVEALPNDHYHAFLDPLVLALTGVGIATLATRLAAQARDRTASRVRAGVALVATVLLVAIAVAAWPPSTAPDGGWASAERDGAAIAEATNGEPFALVGLPAIKRTDAVGFPLERAGIHPLEAAAAGQRGGPPVIVIVCDPTFADVIGASCGGAAEDGWATGAGVADATRSTIPGTGPRRVTTVYAITR